MRAGRAGNVASMPVQPSLREYGFIGDGIGAALVSSSGSIDWCCLGRMDRDSCFARLLDAERGGACWIEGAAGGDQRYLDDTLVLETQLHGPNGSARVLDLFARPGARRLVRIIEGIDGDLELTVHVAARFDYAALQPWVRVRGPQLATLQGGDDAIVVSSDGPLRRTGEDLEIRCRVAGGERWRLSLAPTPPAAVDGDVPAPAPEDVDAAVNATIVWWRQRAAEVSVADASVVRSALTLRALVFEPTGAVAAAGTTSLPERPGGRRNWDYRFSWIRDSTFAARALAAVGMPGLADRFRAFVHRTAAGSADDLQVLYGLGGERHLPERELPLAGYRGSRPVRVGNLASRQIQHDMVGEIMQLAWHAHGRGHAFDDDEWRFLDSVIERAARRWYEPDAGFWEWRGEPRHFVHAKAACWGALDRGLALAEAQDRPAPTARWQRARAAVGSTLDRAGFDPGRRTFVQALGHDALDAVALRLHLTGYVDVDDPRMHGTVDAIRDELAAGDGLLWRYTEDDGIEGGEGAFLACSFWLAEVLATQGRRDEAREVYESALATATPLGLFSEELDPATREPTGNLPQALTHLSHITAALALGTSPR